MCRSKQKLKYSNLQTIKILFAEVRTNKNKCHEKNKKPKPNHILFPSLSRGTKQAEPASWTDR